MNKLSLQPKNLPQKPGVYLFKGANGEVLYVGKAKNLKKRVSSYFGKGREPWPRLDLMLKETADLDYVILSSELESLILENNFIKQYRPRFNIRLRDDKNYQFIKIDYSFEIPQVYAVRRMQSAKNLKSKIFKLQSSYFGPYTSSSAVKQTLKLVKRIFHLCGNKKITNRACFYHHLGRCPGVCVGKTPLQDYYRSLKQVEDFLNHKHTKAIKFLKSQMQKASAQKRFEKAAIIRDKLLALQHIWEKQKIVSAKKVSQDYFGLLVSGKQGIMNLFMVRDGRVMHQENFEVAVPENASPAEITEAFLKQYYADASNFPKEIIVSYKLEDEAAIEKLAKVKIIIPKRGKKLGLLKLAEENAKAYYQKTFASSEQVLADLQMLLRLPKLPQRIEAYDISNLQGFWPVGSMVVFEGGLPKKSDYRKFKINLQQTPDDVAMMKEMLARRFAYLKKNSPSTPALSAPISEVEGIKERVSWEKFPDLVIVDGGKGQLNAVLEVLTAQGLRLKALGLAKRLEELYLPDKKDPIRLPDDSPVLHLLQRIRDEAHRFAITFYRGRHRKYATLSRLDQISGIGPKTRKFLLRKFGSPAGIRGASLEALVKEIGLAKAKKIKESF